MLRRQAVTGADRADIFCSQLCARRDVAHGVKRASKHQVRFCCALVTLPHLAERFPCGPAVTYERRELLRLERERGIGTAVGASEREVFFDNARAECHCANRHGGTQGMIRQAHESPVPLGQMLKRPEVAVARQRRICADAVEQHDSIIAGEPRRSHRFGDFLWVTGSR